MPKHKAAATAASTDDPCWLSTLMPSDEHRAASVTTAPCWKIWEATEDWAGGSRQPASEPALCSLSGSGGCSAIPRFPQPPWARVPASSPEGLRSRSA